MKKHMKHQLALFATLFIVMGCNNAPNAQQATSQEAVTDTNKPLVTTSENSTINKDIQIIDKKIAELEKAEKERISQEIKLIQEKITDLETQENEIATAITQLENRLGYTKTSSNELTQNDSEEPVVSTTEPQLVENINQTSQLASIEPGSVYSWGDWANGIKPAAGLAMTPGTPPAFKPEPSPEINRETLQASISAAETARLTAETVAAEAAAEAQRLAEQARQNAEAEIAQLAQQNGGTLAEGSGVIIITPEQANSR